MKNMIAYLHLDLLFYSLFIGSAALLLVWHG